MEPVAKRRKTAGALAATDEDDELFLEPEELNLRRDPAFQLAKKRARAATQLKNRFEDIFAKYEKDFTGIGDEIDLTTGEVVVDNGHLSSMRSMEDWIVDDDEDEENEEQEGEEEHVLTGDVDGKRFLHANGTPTDPWRIAAPSWPSESESREPPPMGSLLPTPLPFINSNRSFSPFAHESLVSADPNWYAPELPASALLSRRPGPNGRHYGGTTPVVTRTVLKKSVPAPGSPEADEEDDLQTASSSALKSKAIGEPQKIGESPLINKKFPTVDSSPQDNGLHDLIQDVIENIPDTPSSTRRLRLPKSHGKPSPLNQEHRLHSKADSKLRSSETPNNGNGQKAHNKRGRKRLNPGIGKQSRSTLIDQPLGEESNLQSFSDVTSQLWEESDLESFLDVTSQGITKPPGQILHIDIRASSSVMDDMATAEDLSGLHTRVIDAEDADSTFYDDLAVESMVQGSETMHVDIANLDPQDRKASITNKPGQRREVDQVTSRDKFERNVVDPAFIFSDEETLLPKRSKQKRRQSEPVRPPTASVARPRELKDRASGTIALQGKTLSSRKGTVQASPTNGDRIIDLGQRDSPSLEQEKGHPVAEADTRVSRFSKKSTARLATDQSETQEDRAVAMATNTAGETMRTHTSRTHSRRSSQHQSPGVPASFSAERPQSDLPATPRRPRLQQDEKKTPSSVGTSLISLLSDSDDDEDEISFNHSDFTPSGHHRILVHRPLSTASRLSTSSTNKKKRASLLFTRPHSASSRKISKSPRIPRLSAGTAGTAGLDEAGNASLKQSHRRRHKLARSVLQVAHRRDSDEDDREGSVVQTPGGSKRRCGVEGWKCERDFCFVCM